MVESGWAVISMAGTGAGSSTGAAATVGSGVGVPSTAADVGPDVGVGTAVDCAGVGVAGVSGCEVSGSAVPDGVGLTNITVLSGPEPEHAEARASKERTPAVNRTVQLALKRSLQMPGGVARARWI